MKIYKRSDRVTIRVGEVVLKVSPLSLAEKAEISQLLVNGRVKGVIQDLLRGTLLAVKYSVKSVEGFQDGDKKPYQLTFDGEYLSDECAEELLNTELNSKLNVICGSLISKIPDVFTDAEGNKLEGVEVINTGDALPKKEIA